jgi:microcystin-dependent protein
MADPFLGEIRMFGGNFAPLGWAFCSGQLLAIAEFDALFNLIGTTYGGDGQTTFALPNLQGRFAVHQGSNGFSDHVIGEVGGSESVTLNTSEMPSHAHTAVGSGSGNLPSPANAFWSSDPGGNTAAYRESGGSAMSAAALLPAGSGQPHDNRQPYLGVSFIIALEGIFPSQG